jgi:hypothetical protein
VSLGPGADLYLFVTLLCFKSEFERLLSKEEINLDQNAARKAWAEECVRKASEIANGITRSLVKFIF